MKRSGMTTTQLALGAMAAMASFPSVHDLGPPIPNPFVGRDMYPAVFPWAGPEGTRDPARTDHALYLEDLSYYDGLVQGMGEEWTKKVTKSIKDGQVFFNSPDGGTFKFTKPAKPWSTDQPDSQVEVLTRGQGGGNRAERRAAKFGKPRGGAGGKVTRGGTKNKNRKRVGQ